MKGGGGVDLAAAVPWDVEERKGRMRRKCREDAYLYGFFPPPQNLAVPRVCVRLSPMA